MSKKPATIDPFDLSATPLPASISARRAAQGIARRPFLFGLSGLLALIVRERASAQDPPKVGQVDKVRGTATAEKGTDKRTLAPDAALHDGEAIATADQSRVEFRLGQDTTLRLGERARLKIDGFQADSGGEVTLEQGPVLLDKNADSAARPLRVRGPFGLITVRGTKIFAGPSQGVHGILVIQGEVVVEAAGMAVTLHSGQGSDIRFPGAAPTRPRRWSNPRVRAALASVD